MAAGGVDAEEGDEAAGEFGAVDYASGGGFEDVEVAF